MKKEDKVIYDRYKEKLLSSLLNDKEEWIMEGHGAADVSWTEYHSPKYKNIIFAVGTLNFGTCVYVDGKFSFSFRVLPFSKLHKAIREMKRTAKNKAYESYKIKLKESIKEF